MARRAPLSSPQTGLASTAADVRDGFQAAAAISADWARRDTAFAAVCWDNCGTNLVGLVVVRRSDGHSFFIDLPDVLVRKLAILDPVFVKSNSGLLLRIVGEVLSCATFQQDGIITPRLVAQGYQPAIPGTLRHIPAESILSAPSGIPSWQASGYLVDVGEVDLTAAIKAARLH